MKFVNSEESESFVIICLILRQFTYYINEIFIKSGAVQFF